MNNKEGNPQGVNEETLRAADIERLIGLKKAIRAGIVSEELEKPIVDTPMQSKRKKFGRYLVDSGRVHDNNSTPEEQSLPTVEGFLPYPTENATDVFVAGEIRK